MCGIVGVIGAPQASQEVYQGLLLLQHRGQDSAGILSYDQTHQTFHEHKDLGRTGEVFNSDNLKKLTGSMALGHTRYSTIGRSTIQDVQPVRVGYPFGIGIVHNGNLVNFPKLRELLEEKYKRHIFSNNDIEGILNILADGLIKQGADKVDFEDMIAAVDKVFQMAKGGFSVLSAVAHHGLLAFRDPKGIRPLILGKRKLLESEREGSSSEYAYCLASESNVLNFLGYQVERDLRPGEVVFINQKGEFFSHQLKNEQGSPCMFEWIYFATPETTLENKNVYKARLKMGEILAKEIQPLVDAGDIKPDMIVPVPETSRVSAISLSETLGIPYREVLIKNRYIQRSFILNTQESRTRAVQLKLTPVISELKGKKVLLVDDSIVRGTTSKRIVEMVREAGASEVYMASTCPPITHPCYYGIDFPDPNELVAYGKGHDEIEKTIGLDKLIYMSIEGLKKSIELPKLCMACLTGEYPVPVDDAEHFRANRVK
jgi:amidophosphoribosyltransferase